MPKKMGRPLKNDTPRNDHLSIRLSTEEKAEITECAKLLGLERVDAIMHCIRKEIKELKK